MPSCPLYKSLKSNGTSFYAFPGAAEDISAAYQNSNYKMYFSKYALLNFPKQNLVAGLTSSKPIYFDFENDFIKSSNATPTANFQDQIIESLRNYVANQEVVIRESRLNNTKYYYNNNALETTTEKIFWKWCKKSNIIDFETAIPQDEYFNNLSEFESKNINADDYFPEFLWKEREIIPYSTRVFYLTSNPNYSGKMEVEFSGTTNFRVGDIVKLYSIGNSTIWDQYHLSASSSTDISASNTTEGFNTTVLNITPAGATQGQLIIFDIDTVIGAITELTGKAEVVYNRLVQYIGEINGVSNVQEANRSYTEVYAHIPDHTGKTPDILFRTMTDVNYKPNLTFPIIPNQYQPEILGSELFNSPLVSSPQDYPGSYFGQFDTYDFTYETATGDSIRRSGNYFGVKGDINNPVVNGSTIDGINMDFNRSHYVKMNIANRSVTNFDQFNALEVNNQPPSDFEFNAILWYYTVEDGVSAAKTNLYGITFLDNPDNNLKPEDVGIKFPTYKKLVSNGQQDGTSYSFSLLLNFNIINDNPQDAYNPEAINSLFSMNLFNEAMSRLASTNDSFLNIISEQGLVRDEIIQLKGLLYSQTDINTINAKIQNLENLLRLYSTNQLISSNSISVNTTPGSPPLISLVSTDPSYIRVDKLKTTDMYNAQGIIPINLSIPVNKSFLLYLSNNDEVQLSLPNNDKLTIVLDRDLDNNQFIDIVINASEFSSQNKKLDIYIKSDIGNVGNTAEILLVGDIDLPVFYNPVTQLPNSAYTWNNFNFDIDFDQSIKLNTGSILNLPLSGNTSIINNSIKSGDTFYLNNLFLGTSSVYNFSGQYVVSSMAGSTSSYINLDISSNPDFVAYGASSSLPLTLHGTSSTLLSNLPYLSLNKGKKIRINKISTSNVLSERYYVDIHDIN